MKHGLSRCAALMGTVLSLSSFAQVCQEVSLYKNGEPGQMMQNSSFPESPEWVTNWGTLDGMQPPYIRWSGMKNQKDSWKGNLSFGGLPVSVQGGNVALKVRATQTAKFGLWLVGDFGESKQYVYDLAANKTYDLQVPVNNLLDSGSGKVNAVGVGLLNVPAFQYTTLFVDDVALTCSVSKADEAEEGGYVYGDVNAVSPQRESRFLHKAAEEIVGAYTVSQRDSLQNLTKQQFVLSYPEHSQIVHFLAEETMTAKKSKEGWFRNLYFVERNRLKDSVIANPKTLAYEAEAFAAASDNSAMPILVGNVDYGYEVCADTSCESRQVLNSRILQAGLPVDVVRGSRIKLYYDPYFICTNRATMPTVEINVNNQWRPLPLKSEVDVAFESAGLQKIRVRLSEGGLTKIHNIFVEVK